MQDGIDEESLYDYDQEDEYGYEHVYAEDYIDRDLYDQ